MSSMRRVALPQLSLLIGGDLLVFLLFAAIGRRSHGEAAGLAAIGEVALTAAPFALGWLLVAPALGAYRADLRSRLDRMLLRSGLAWAGAWPVGLVLRAILLQRAIPWSFALVTLFAVTVLLLAWRAVFVLVVRHK